MVILAWAWVVVFENGGGAAEDGVAGGGGVHGGQAGAFGEAERRNVMMAGVTKP